MKADRRGSSLQTVSGRWIAGAVAVVIAAAGLCMWGALCLIFWLGSWQLLYHPTATVVGTPANAGMNFDTVDFATTESGQPQLHGWWIPGGPESRITAIYLHGAKGNIGDAVRDLRLLHDAKMNVLGFDYRGYGASRFERPSEAHWRQDAEAAMQYLTQTRHISAREIVLVGSGLGANLALETGAAHPELAGVVLDGPSPSPEDLVFNDPRARLVPARWLVADRWELARSSGELRIPSLWFVQNADHTANAGAVMSAYNKVSARKLRVWVNDTTDRSTIYREAIERWLDELAPTDAPR